MKIIAAILVALMTWVYSDILIWQRIFETNHLDQYDKPYQHGHAFIFFGLACLGMIMFMPSAIKVLYYYCSLTLLCYGGWADILYYWLDGKAIPAKLPWLELYHPLIWHPVTSLSILLGALVWVFLILIVFVIGYRQLK